MSTINETREDERILATQPPRRTLGALARRAGVASLVFTASMAVATAANAWPVCGT